MHISGNGYHDEDTEKIFLVLFLLFLCHGLPIRREIGKDRNQNHKPWAADDAHGFCI